MLNNLAYFGLRKPCLVFLAVLLFIAITAGEWLMLISVLLGVIGGDVFLGKVLRHKP